MNRRTFGTLPSGETVEAITLHGTGGASLEFLTFGGIVTSILVPDRSGRIGDVVLGFDHLEPYLAGHPFFGAIIGRVAGRIPGARFTLDGKVYDLEKNDGPNHLHGGSRGLDKRLWAAEPRMRPDGADSMCLTYESPQGEAGYPGTLLLCLNYTFTRDNIFVIESTVTSDRETPASLTHHGYFNLAGEGSGSVLAQELGISSGHIIAVDEMLTPLGRALPVEGHAHDLRIRRRLGDIIPGLFKNHGDLYVLPGDGGLRPAAELYDPASGRMLSVSTDERCLQFYTGASLDGSIIGKSGRPYIRHSGLCLECEGYPGGADNPAFGSILVSPDQPLHRTTRYAFSVT